MCSCTSIAVLIVDDDVAFRLGVAANLVDDGHVVFECATAPEATAGLLDAADVVVTHFHMTTTNGIAFADEIHRTRPELPILLVTAYWTVEVEAAAAMRPYVHLCRRPIDYDDLHARIHDVACVA